jgi:hypothetical protein
MKLKPIVYRHAAETYDIEVEAEKGATGICYFLNEELVQNHGHRDNLGYTGPYFDALYHYFKPVNKTAWWGEAYSNDPQEVKDCRVLTLLFMEQIAKDL